MLCELLLRCRIPKLLSCTALLRHHVPRFQQHHLLDCWDQLLSLVQQRRKGSRLQQRKLRNWTMMVECFRQRLNIIRHPILPTKTNNPKNKTKKKKERQQRKRHFKSYLYVPILFTTSPLAAIRSLPTITKSTSPVRM